MLQPLHTLLSPELWYRLLTMRLSILGNNQQTSNKTMKNQGENKNRSKESPEFIHFIADMTGPLHIFHFSLSNTYISDLKREYQ